MQTEIYVDIVNKRFVVNAANGNEYPIGVLEFADYLDLKTIILKPRSTAYFTSGAASVQDVSTFSMEMYVGLPGVPWAGQTTWTAGGGDTYYTGTLDLNTTQIDDALTANSDNPVACRLEVRLKSGSKRYTISQAIFIRRPVHPPTAPDPTEYTPDSALLDALETILVDTPTTNWTRSGDTMLADGRMPVTRLEKVTYADGTTETPQALSTTLVVGKWYRLQYVDGAVKLAAGQTWRMGRYTLAGAGDVTEIGSDTQYDTEAQAALANACTFVNFQADDTELTMLLVDVAGAYGDNTLGTPAPRFELWEYDDQDAACCVGCPQGTMEVRTISAAGDVILTPRSHLHHAKITVSDSYGGGAIAIGIVLPTAEGTWTPNEGDRALLQIILPASSDPTVTIYDTDTGGTAILAIQSVLTASELKLQCVFNGTAWVRAEPFDWRTSTGERILNTYTRRTVTYAASLAIDMDDAAYQDITLTGDLAITTLSASRASAGLTKAVALRLIASGAERTATLDSDIKCSGAAAIVISDGKEAWVAIESTGSAETDTRAAYAKEL